MTTNKNRTDRALSAATVVSRRDAVRLLGAAVGAAALPGSAFADAKKGGILRVAAPANPSSLDPVTGGAGTDHVFLFTMFDTLIEWDYETLKAKPGLAEAWSYPDPKTLLLTLRQGVKFHDGTPLDAAAVKANLDRAKSDPRSNLKGDLTTVDTVEVVGPNQVALKLTQPDSALPLILSDRAGMMASPKAFQELGKEHDRKPVGAGRWKIVEWRDNEKVTVTRNDNYWRAGEPLLDGIELSIITEINTGLRSVTAGQNDFVYFLTPQMKQIAGRSKNLTTASGPTLYCLQFYLNYSRPPFNDVRVRKAFNMAVDREAFNKAIMMGLAEVASTALPSAHWAFDKSLAGFYSYDPEGAKKLLAEAGFKDGIDINALSYTDQRSVQMQEVLIEQAKKAGFRLKFTNGSIPEMSAAFFAAEKRGDTLLSAWTGRPDPSLTFSLMFAKDAYFNAGRTEASPELTQALLASRRDESLDDRRKALSQVQRLVLENALAVPLVFQPNLDAFALKVKGYRPNLLGKAKFEGVSIEG